MLAQYVHRSPSGLFRIVRHGHRWRSVHDRVEIGRHAAEQEALEALRARFPQERLPRTLERWRFVPAAGAGAYAQRPRGEPTLGGSGLIRPRRDGLEARRTSAGQLANPTVRFI